MPHSIDSREVETSLLFLVSRQKGRLLLSNFIGIDGAYLLKKEYGCYDATCQGFFSQFSKCKEIIPRLFMQAHCTMHFFPEASRYLSLLPNFVEVPETRSSRIIPFEDSEEEDRKIMVRESRQMSFPVYVACTHVMYPSVLCPSFHLEF